MHDGRVSHFFNCKDIRQNIGPIGGIETRMLDHFWDGIDEIHFIEIMRQWVGMTFGTMKHVDNVTALQLIE